MPNKQGTITSSAAAVLTANGISGSPRVYYKIHSISFCSDNAGAEVVDAYIVKSGDSPTNGASGNKVIVDLSIATNTSYTTNGENWILAPGDAIYLKGDTGNIVNYNIGYTVESSIA